MKPREIPLAPKRQRSKAAVVSFSVVSLMLLAIAACDTVPSAGPRPDTFNNARWEYVSPEGGENETAGVPFVLVDVDKRVIEALEMANDEAYFKGEFTDQSPPSKVALGVGDVIRVTIFEAGAGGLFTPVGSTSSNGNFVTLPDQEVDQSGRISVPYAEKGKDSGLISVVGKQPIEVQQDIQNRLMNKAIEPQVLVTLVKRSSNQYSVIGDVGAPGRFSLTQSGVRVLEALSVAGGPKSNDYNTLITLQRGTKSATARLSTVMRAPENNIFVQPADLISVKKEERYYNILGATKSNNRVPFEAEKVTLADALAKAGGLSSELAEPEAVIIFRRENPKTLTKLSVTLEGHNAAEPVPAVYRFNLSEPSGMFLAQRTPLHSDDVIYVANHSFSDVSKLLSVVRDILLIRLINN